MIEPSTKHETIMNKEEYEKAKVECWEDYTRASSHDGKSAYGAFLYAFDRAYTLGKKEKDAEGTLTIKKSSDKLKVGDIAINTYENLTDVYIAGIEETSYGIVYTTAYYSNERIYIERYHENYLIKK